MHRPDDRPALAAAARAGLTAMAPIYAGVVPFGLLAGVAAVEAGFGLGGAVAFSVGLFAGASQLAALELLARGAPAAVAVATVVAINLRFLMYGASLAPHWAGLPLRSRLGWSYVLTDQAYAVAVGWYQAGRRPTTPRERLAFYAGGAAPMWLVWQASTVVGAVVGDALPEGFPLSFALPLMFLALLVPALRSRPMVLAAVVSGAVAVLARDLPANLGMPLAAAIGIATGTVAAERSTHREVAR